MSALTKVNADETMRAANSLRGGHVNGIERAQWMRGAQPLCGSEHVARYLYDGPECAIGGETFHDCADATLVERSLRLRGVATRCVARLAVWRKRRNRSCAGVAALRGDRTRRYSA